jgi:hypothetical protein
MLDREKVCGKKEKEPINPYCIPIRVTWDCFFDGRNLIVLRENWEEGDQYEGTY